MYSYKMRKLHIILVALSLIGAWSCQPDPLKDLSLEDSNVFITNYIPSTNFGSYRTFSIADSVFVLQNQRSGISTTSRDFTILNQVASNLNQRGYKRVARTANPDVGVNVIRISETQTGIIPTQNPWLWNSYWGYGSGFGPGYYYPTTYSYYQTTETYWYIEVIDLKNLTQNQQAPVVWSAQIRGGGIFEESALAGIINSVFAQSPYLKAL